MATRPWWVAMSNMPSGMATRPWRVAMSKWFLEVSANLWILFLRTASDTRLKVMPVT
jgi:hypothetical protein